MEVQKPDYYVVEFISSLFAVREEKREEAIFRAGRITDPRGYFSGYSPMETFRPGIRPARLTELLQTHPGFPEEDVLRFRYWHGNYYPIWPLQSGPTNHLLD